LIHPSEMHLSLEIAKLPFVVISLHRQLVLVDEHAFPFAEFALRKQLVAHVVGSEAQPLWAKAAPTRAKTEITNLACMFQVGFGGL